MVSLRRRTALIAAAAVAAALIAVAVAWWMLRRRGSEGFRWADKKTGVATVSNPKHVSLIKDWCRSGKPQAALLDSDYDFLAKYTKNAVREHCAPGRQAWRSVARGVGAFQGAVDYGRCGSRGGCERAALRVTHPCANKGGKKCCLYRDQWTEGGKNCIETKGALKYEEMEKQLKPGGPAVTTSWWNCMLDNRRVGGLGGFEGSRSQASKECNKSHGACGGKCKAYQDGEAVAA